MEGWICPRCYRVWGPFVMACASCNAPTLTTYGTGGVCGTCHQDRNLPAGTGCNPGSHYRIRV